MARTYETALKIGAFIAREFSGNAKNASVALKGLTASVKQLKEAEKSAAAFKKLDDELGKARTRYNTATEAMRKLEAAEKAAGGATRDSTKWRKAGAREIAAASRQMDRASAASKKHGEALQKLGFDTSKLVHEQERLTRALAATERQEKSLERFEHARERIFGARKEKTPLIEKGKEQLKGVGETVLHLAEGALVAGEAMHLLVEKTMHVGAEVGESAEKLGIGAKALQELRYGARQSGAEVGSLDRALAKMAINIGKHKQAKKGGASPFAIPGLQVLSESGKAAGAVVDPFRQIGLKVADLAKLKPEEQFKKIAEGMAKLKTHADKAAVAQEIFGKGSSDILPYLAEGKEGIEKLSKQANQYGGVLSEESIAAAVAAEKASKDMNMALGGVMSTLGAALLPVAVKTFKSISVWVRDNRENIKQWAEKAAKWIEDKAIPAFKKIAGEVKEFAGKVMHLVEGAARLTGGFGNLAIVLAGLRLAPTIATFAKIGIEAVKATAAVLQYVAAQKAAQAAGVPGGPGATGKAMGRAANAAMLAGAAGIGYAMGTALDSYFDLSGKLTGLVRRLAGDDAQEKATGDAVAGAHQAKLALFRQRRDARIAEFESQGLTHGQAINAADRGGPAAVRTGGGKAGGGVSVVTNIHGDAGKHHVAHAMDVSKQKALDAIDKRDRHRARVAYGQ